MFKIDGFCKEEEKLFGPVQLQFVPLVALPDNFNVDKVQTGICPAEAAAFDGIFVFTTTDDVLDCVEPQLLVAFKV